MTTLNRPTLLDPVQTAHELGISRSTVFELLKTGELRSVQIGRLRRIPAAAIDDYVASLEQRTTAA